MAWAPRAASHRTAPRSSRCRLRVASTGSRVSAAKYSSDLYYGAVTAMDAVTHQVKAKAVTEIEVRSGITATAGGLVFSALQDGWVVAYDDETLQELWRFSVGTPLKGAPVTYAVGPKQYVAVQTRRAAPPPSELRQSGELELLVRLRVGRQLGGGRSPHLKMAERRKPPSSFGQAGELETASCPRDVPPMSDGSEVTPKRLHNLTPPTLDHPGAPATAILELGPNCYPSVTPDEVASCPVK